MSQLLGSTPTRVNAVQDTVYDQRGLQSIRRMGNNDQTPEAIKEISKKFESMLLQQMLKTMRETNEVISEGSYFSSNEEKFHQDMLDQQLVLNLTSGRGIGLSDHFYKHMMLNQERSAKAPVSTTSGDIRTNAEAKPLTRGDGSLPLYRPGISLAESSSSAPNNANASTQAADADDDLIASLERELARLTTASANKSDTRRLAITEEELLANKANDAWIGDHFSQEGGNNGRSPFVDFTKTFAGSGLRRAGETASSVYFGAANSAMFSDQKNFVERIRPHAEIAAAELNVDPKVLIAQAALETGWGKHVIQTKQGESSHNLFNIKASGNWSGDRVSVSTLEYQGGVSRHENAQFRKYANFEQSFNDYVDLIKSSGRYEKALSVSENPERYADALQAAGYATDPNYAKKIKQLLKHELIGAAPTIATMSKSVLSNAAGSVSRFME